MAASHLVSTVAQLQHGSGGGAMQLRYEPLRGLVIYIIASLTNVQVRGYICYCVAW